MNVTTECELTIRYVMSLLIYRYNILRREDIKISSERIILLFKFWLKRLKEKTIIEKYNLIFDESIWPANEPERHENVVLITIKTNAISPEYNFEIDLSKPPRTCATILYGVGVRIKADLFPWEEK